MYFTPLFLRFVSQSEFDASNRVYSQGSALSQITSDVYHSSFVNDRIAIYSLHSVLALFYTSLLSISDDCTLCGFSHLVPCVRTNVVAFLLNNGHRCCSSASCIKSTTSLQVVVLVVFTSKKAETSLVKAQLLSTGFLYLPTLLEKSQGFLLYKLRQVSIYSAIWFHRPPPLPPHSCVLVIVGSHTD